jgi:tRNA U54 and U55 pseudouridine synthase Pus10
VSRKYKGNLNGERYVANTSPYKREVHDLDNENRNCVIDEIIRARQDKPYRSLEDATRDEFKQCPFCCPLVDNSAAAADSANNALAGIKSRVA